MRQYTTEDRETIYGWWKAEQKDWHTVGKANAVLRELHRSTVSRR